MNTNKSCNTVVILCAGSGDRLKPYTKNIHKALLPVDNQAIISKIIDKFPKNFKFIIPVGSKKDQIEYFCKTVHKEINFQFVNVKYFKGKGSGPGLSLLKCKRYIKSPFYVTTCDTLFEKFDFKRDNNNQNWVAISKTTSSISENYCCFSVKKKKVTKIYDKEKNIKNVYPFVGLFKIYDYKIFFKDLSKSLLIDNEKQISNGFISLIELGKLKTKKMDWEDLGNKNDYENYKKKYEKYDFSKKDEYIYLYKDKLVGKFFVNTKISTDRYERAKLLYPLAPTLISNKKNFYFYRWFSGKTLYENCTPKLFLKFLKNMKNNLWNKTYKVKNFNLQCKKFYKFKTKKRINDFKLKYNKYDNIQIINNYKVPIVDEILKSLDWKKLFKGYPTNFHGDLQFDNILFNRKFILIDWRDSFAGHKLGDIYYDLAKLMGGLIINYKLIKKNKFSYLRKKNIIKINLPKFKYQNNFQKILNNFIIQNNFDIFKVRILTGLIFLNMSPLHHYPFDKLLFCYGKQILWKTINENK